MFTRDDIFRQLSAMNAPRDKEVIFHSSLRAIGEVEGRAEGLLEILIEYFTARGGLLCIPALTWKNIHDPSVITLDMPLRESCIGTMPNIAARHSKGHRSANPTHSMVVFGEGAEEFIAGEAYLPTPVHPKGCYGKICDRGGFVLLAGVDHHANTVMHGVEELLDVPNRFGENPKPATVRFFDGTVIGWDMHYHYAKGIGDVSTRYPKYEPAFRYHGCITDGFLGSAHAQLCDAAKLRKVMTLIHQRSGGVELLANTEPIEPALYTVK